MKMILGQNIAAANAAKAASPAAARACLGLFKKTKVWNA